MKKNLIVLLIILLSGCRTNNLPAPPTPTAESSLFDKVQAQLDDTVYKAIQCDEKSCKLDTEILKEGMGEISDISYLNKEVYLVEIINIESKSLPNNIIIYVSMDNEEIIGYGYLD